jgi:hypothetical protein
MPACQPNTQVPVRQRFGPPSRGRYDLPHILKRRPAGRPLSGRPGPAERSRIIPKASETGCAGSSPQGMLGGMTWQRPEALPVLERRLRLNLDRLDRAVNTIDPLTTPAVLADVLDAFYVLGRVWREDQADGGLGQHEFDNACREDEGGQIVGALVYARGLAAHKRVVFGSFEDIVAARLYSHFGCWVWQSLQTQSNDELAQWYRKHLAGREVPLPLPAAERFLTEFVKGLKQ